MKKVATESRTKRVYVPRLPGKPDEEQMIIVGHNFRNYAIRRGVEVVVPIGVAKRLEQYMIASEDADRENLALMKKYSGA